MSRRPRDINYGEPTVSVPSAKWEQILAPFRRQFPGLLRTLTFALKNTTGYLYAEVASEAAQHALIALFKQQSEIRSLKAHVAIVGAFRPANRKDPFDAAFDSLGKDREPTTLQNDSEDSIERHPHIKCIGDVKFGAEVAVKVSLETEQDAKTAGGPATFSDLPIDWEEIEVEVVLTSAQLDIEPNELRKLIHIKRSGRATSVLFSGIINEAAKTLGHVQVDVSFFFEGRRCGEARRTFDVEVGELEDIGVTLPPVQGVTGQMSGSKNFSVPATIRRNLPSATMTITVVRDGSNSDGRFMWLGYSRLEEGDTRTTSGPVELGSSREEFVSVQLGRCANLDGKTLKRTFRSVGETLWKKLPSDFKTQYLDLVEVTGGSFPIQIFTEEPLVPWEMVWPMSLPNDDDSDHWFMSHPIARWSVNGSVGAAAQFRAGEIASFVPDYGDSDTLPSALEEGRWLVAKFRATKFEPTSSSFLDLLEGPPEGKSFQIVHFAGHGKNGDQTRSANIRMKDNPVTVDEIKQSGVRLGRRDRSLFILNACSIGAATIELGTENSWAAALTENGFGGVISPLWPVLDEHASDLVKHTVTDFLVNEKTLAESLRDARNACRHKSPTPYAYLLHGDVTARAI